MQRKEIGQLVILSKNSFASKRHRWHRRETTKELPTRKHLSSNGTEYYHGRENTSPDRTPKS